MMTTQIMPMILKNTFSCCVLVLSYFLFIFIRFCSVMPITTISTLLPLITTTVSTTPIVVVQYIVQSTPIVTPTIGSRSTIVASPTGATTTTVNSGST